MPSTSPRPLPQHIAKLRISRGWTQGELAEQMTAAGYSVGRQAISHHETGRRQISVRAAAAYRAVYDLRGKALAAFNLLVLSQEEPAETASRTRRAS